MNPLDKSVVVIGHDEDVTISTRKKGRSNTPPFTMIGRQAMIKGQIQGFPLMKVLFNSTKEELWFCELLWDNLNIETNQANLNDLNFDRTNLNKISKVYGVLSSKNLVKRVQRGIYMFNPDAIIYPASYQATKKIWDSLA